MPLDPPVMTATLPSSLPMTSPFAALNDISVFTFTELGPAAFGVECETSQIGGAKLHRMARKILVDGSDKGLQDALRMRAHHLDSVEPKPLGIGSRAREGVDRV